MRSKVRSEPKRGLGNWLDLEVQRDEAEDEALMGIAMQPTSGPRRNQSQ